MADGIPPHHQYAIGDLKKPGSKTAAEVSIIDLKWRQGLQCRYPYMKNYTTTKMNTILRNRQEPTAKWPLYDCRIRYTFGG